MGSFVSFQKVVPGKLSVVIGGNFLPVQPYLSFRQSVHSAILTSINAVSGREYGQLCQLSKSEKNLSFGRGGNHRPP